MKPFDRRLLRYARATRIALGVAVALGIATAALAVAEAALLGTSIADAFEGGADLAALAPRLTLLAVVLGGRAALAWGGEAAAYRISASVKSSLRRQVLVHVAGLGPRWASGSRSGEIVTLATRGLDTLDAYFARYLPQLVLAVIVPVAVVACIAFADLIAAATVALTVPLIPLFMVLIGKATEQRRRRRWTALSRLSTYFLDVVAGLPTLRAFGRSTRQLPALRRVTDDYRRETLATLRVAFLSAFALELAATLSVALVAVGIGLRLVAGELSLSTGLFVLVLAPEAYLPLRTLGASFHASEEGLAAAGAAFAILETSSETAGGSLEPPGPGELAVIAVTGVSVVQPGRAELAPWDVSFEIRAGQIVALQGPSGCGKSTLLRVLLGLLVPDAGVVAVERSDGRGSPGGRLRLDELDGTAWRRRVAYVPQEPFFASGSVAENVRIVAPEASDAEIAAGLAEVGLGGLDPGSLLGERGAGLSSGQRRRLALARALLRRADLLLLDEPTAGLDQETEALVLRTVAAAARRGVAIVLVAHRPAALAIADRVVAVARRGAEEAA